MRPEMARMTRRELLAGTAVAALAGGCSPSPGERGVYLVAKGIGLAAGLVIAECKLSPEARLALATVVERIVSAVPGPGERPVSAWLALARRHVDSMVSDGRVSPLAGAVAVAAFAIVVHAYAIVEARHPQVGAVRRLACAAVSGLAAGVLSVLRAKNPSVQGYDTEAYKALGSYSGTVVLQVLATAADTTGRMAQTPEK